MQFHKISDHKIHCIISHEEMDEMGIAIDDFLDHRDKTEAFLREILAEAKYELDLDDMGHYFSVQMSVMPEGDVSLVISGEDSKEDATAALTELGKRLQDFRELMEEARQQLEKQKNRQKEGDSQQQETQEGQTTKQAEAVPSSGQDDTKQSVRHEILQVPVWVGLPTLDACIRVSKHLVNQRGLASAVYKYRDTYYMRLMFSDEEHQMAGTILTVAEYTGEIFTDDQGGAMIHEHGTVICADHAIETLASL